MFPRIEEPHRFSQRYPRTGFSADATTTVVTGTGSGKTECFMATVIQNAIEDATRFKRSGLMAILVYPMNALAADREARI